MEATKIQLKEQEKKIDLTQKKATKKTKAKKKSKKLKQEKHYKNLKELLEDMKQEEISKTSKEKKEKENPKEEIKMEEIPIKDCLSINNQSISGTTVCSLSLDGNENYSRRNTIELIIKPNFILKSGFEKNEEEINEDNNYIKRKMSSPIFDYYNGFDNFLNKENNEKIDIDINKSSNFVKKSKFIEEAKKIEIKEKKEIKNSYNDNSKIDNKFNIEFYYNNNMNYPMYNYIDYYNYNNLYDQYNNNNSDFQNMINNINQKYYSFPYNKKNKNEKGKIKYGKKYFDNNDNKNDNKSKRSNGEWICKFCHNLNYSFRKLCNRCNALKQT